MHTARAQQELLTQPKRHSCISKDLNRFSEIFSNDINIAVWKRKLEANLHQAAQNILREDPNFNLSLVPRKHEIKEVLISELGSKNSISILIDDISRLANLFCSLFELDRVWIRLDAINRPMCPRFHTDALKCRLVTTYIGPATEWLPHHLVDRSKLGSGNNGQPDQKSGLFKSKVDIQKLNTGDVALLKGDAWEGNEEAGIVHRSPHSEDDYKRLYMTIDFQELFLKIYQQNKRFAMLN